MRARLSADYGRLDFMRVLRSQPAERISDPGGLVATRPAGRGRPDGAPTAPAPESPPEVGGDD